MNMGRALNVFILIFLLLNLGLYYINNRTTEHEFVLSEERHTHLLEVMDRAYMPLYGELPTFEPRPRLIVVEPENQEGAIVQAMFGGEEHETDYSDAHIHRQAGEQLTFRQGSEKGLVLYAAEDPGYVPAKFDSVGKDRIVSEFVGDLSLGNSQFKLDGTRDDVYYFYERYEEAFLFCNEVVVKMTDQVGITEARMIRYVPVMYEEVTYEIYPPDQVLYKFVSYISETDEEIGGIRLDIGYNLGADNTGTWHSQALDPYYRIRVASGVTYFVNAYTNEIVQ